MLGSYFITSLPCPSSKSAHIGMRSHRSDSTAQFHYALSDDGRIWARSLDPVNPRRMVSGDLIPDKSALNWHLFDGTGLPVGKDNCLLLTTAEHLIEISVASEVVIAVSNLDKVYIYKHTVLTRPVVWSDAMGKPFAATLYLPAQRRAWTFSCSVGYPRRADGSTKRNLNAVARSEQFIKALVFLIF